MKKLLLTLGLISTAFLVPQSVLADGQYNCSTVAYGGYGGNNCVSGTLSINKTVQNPANNQFVDNLDSSNPYQPNQDVTFQITVSNTGTATIYNVVAKDMLPNYIDYATSSGSFDGSKTITFNVGQLNPGASQTYYVIGRFEATTSLPANTNITCVVNQAIATANNQPQAQDNSQVCVEKNVATNGGQTVYAAPTAKTTPSTGANPFALLALIPAAFAGLKLRKIAILS